MLSDTKYILLTSEGGVRLGAHLTFPKIAHFSKQILNDESVCGFWRAMSRAYARRSIKTGATNSVNHNHRIKVLITYFEPLSTKIFQLELIDLAVLNLKNTNPSKMLISILSYFFTYA